MEDEGEGEGEKEQRAGGWEWEEDREAGVGAAAVARAAVERATVEVFVQRGGRHHDRWGAKQRMAAARLKEQRAEGW